jgi:hypothetical protein
MTPNDIEVLIHYATRCVEHPRSDAPAVIETTRKFIEQGIMTDILEKKCYEKPLVTEFGFAYLRLLCRIKPPKLAYIDENSREI